MDFIRNLHLSRENGKPLLWWLLFSIDSFLVGCLVTAVWWAAK
jgi:hypothetical protein